VTSAPQSQSQIPPGAPGASSAPAILETHARVITALVQDKPGVLARISGLFRRRGLNIASLTVGHSENTGLSRMTFVVEGPQHIVRHIAAQLDRLIDVVEVEDISEKNTVWRELALIKVAATPATRTEVLQLASIFRVSVVDVGAESLTIEVTGDSGKIDSLVELLKQYGVRVVMRTGKVAVLRGSLVAGEPDGAYHMRSVAGRITPAELAGDDSGAV
jgi:acetolactate synthase-1/3 small subunit